MWRVKLKILDYGHFVLIWLKKEDKEEDIPKQSSSRDMSTLTVNRITQCMKYSLPEKIYNTKSHNIHQICFFIWSAWTYRNGPRCKIF